MQPSYNYQQVLTNSERVNWRVEDIIGDMERAFAEEARGVAVNKPRTRYKVPPDTASDGYMANIIPGAVSQRAFISRPP